MVQDIKNKQPKESRHIETVFLLLYIKVPLYENISYSKLIVKFAEKGFFLLYLQV